MPCSRLVPPLLLLAALSVGCDDDMPLGQGTPSGAGGVAGLGGAGQGGSGGSGQAGSGGSGGPGGQGGAGSGGQSGSAQAGGGGAGASGSAGQGSECKTNQDCAGQSGGQQLCKGGTCVSAISPECVQILGDVLDEPSQIYGVLAPLSGDHAAVGASYVAAVRMAIKEYTQVGSPVARPLVVVCDELSDPEKATKHLIEAVGAKVIVGPAWGAAITKVVPLALQSPSMLLLPLDDDPALETTPGKNGQLWGLQPNRSSVVAYWKSAIGEVEKQVKAKAPGLSALRMAVAVAGDTSSQTLAGLVQDKTFFNGKSALDNQTDGNYSRLDYADAQVSKVNYAPVILSLIKQAPNLVVLLSSGGVSELVSGVEKAWPTGASAPPRPTYLLVGALEEADAMAAQAGSSGLASRLLGLDALRDDSTQQLHDAFAAQYKAQNSGQLPLAGSAFYYDGFWLAHYALYAARGGGKLPVSGVDGPTFSAGGVGLLNPPGTSISVGAPGINQALSGLTAGSDVDLNGASSRLDFDLVKGTVQTLGALYCFKDAKLVFAPSGLTFDPGTGQASGAPSCL